MKRNRRSEFCLPALISAVCSLFPCPLHAIVSLDWVIVGNAGNAADGNGIGSVAGDYRIGKYEVTNAQYAEFLNATAATDANGLYSTNMGTNANGGITRSGSSGSYSYGVKSGYADKPVVWVSFLDAMRFANWIHNGQGAGSTESGAYDMTQPTSTVIHSSNAAVWIPTENEWYKAAYHQPAGAGGDVDGYWLYPTRSNTQPTSATAPSSISGAANYRYDDGTANGVNGGFAVTQTTSFDGGQNYLTDTGSYANSASYYGTFDQGGNVSEWTEALVFADRRLRGGGWDNTELSLRSSIFTNFGPSSEDYAVGFRLAGAVPEPSRLMMLMAGMIPAILRRRRQ